MARGMKITTMENIMKAVAELIGTGLLVFFGCMGCISGWDSKPTHLSICITFGLAVMFIIQIFGHISGAHLNPSVSVTAFISKQITLPMLGVYFVSQCLGGFLGFGFLKLLTPDIVVDPTNGTSSAPGLCSTLPAPGVSAWQAIGVEFMMTFVLGLVCCAVWDSRNTDKHDSVTIRFGLTISGLALAGGPYTGGSMNPARSLGPAIWNGDWDYHYVYWVGPLTAAALSALLYRACWYKPPPSIPTHEDVPLQSK